MTVSSKSQNRVDDRLFIAARTEAASCVSFEPERYGPDAVATGALRLQSGTRSSANERPLVLGRCIQDGSRERVCRRLTVASSGSNSGVSKWCLGWC
jgi:hypothetical protein